MVTERDGPDPHSQGVQLQALDALVLEALQARPPAATACTAARSMLEAGHVDAAVAVLKDVCPHLIQAGGRYHFKLVKQKFVELCNSGSDSKAIACARDELAPLALDAYPEAYEEFKACLQLLVYTKDVQRQRQDSVRLICSPASRSDLAAAVYHAAMQTLELQEPMLLRVLAYLLRLHRVHRSASPTTPTQPEGQLQEQELADRLLLQGRDAAPLPCEGGLSSFKEADLQALIHCAGSSRREAMDALRRVHGNVQQAFCSELSRLRIDLGLLGQLLEEYVAFRGLESQVATRSSGEAEPWVPMSGTQLPGCAGRTGVTGEGDLSGYILVFAAWRADHGADRDADAGNRAGSQAGAGSSSGAGSRCGVQADASSKGQAPWSVRQHLNLLHSERSVFHSPPTKVPRCQGHSSNGQSQQQHPQPQQPQKQATAREPRNCNMSAASPHTWQSDLLHLITDLAKEGQVQQIIQAVTDADAEFFDGHQQLFFDLKQCEFLQLLEAGDTSAALAYTRMHLAPLADQQEVFQQSLKATTAMLLGIAPREQAAAALQRVAAGLQAALRVHLGMHGPLLIRLLQALLGVHRAWLRREKFSDPFQRALKLDALREVATVTTGVPAGSAGVGGARVSGTARASSDGSSLPDLVAGSSDDDDTPAGVDEDRILRVMEVLELPRSTAMDLLIHHDWDVEAAIMSSLA